MALGAGANDLLSTPAAPTVVQNATAAGAAVTYQVVAVNGVGQDSIPSPVTSTPANNAVPPNNTISWVAQPEVTAWRVLKGGNLLATLPAGVTSFTDSAGAAGVAYVAATSNPPALLPVVNSQVDGAKATYRFAILGYVPVATPTNILSIIGSPTRLTRLLWLVITGLQTTAGIIDVRALKQSTVDTGGTPTPVTLVPNDSSSIPATTVVQTYGANPAPLGTLVGMIHTEKLFVPAPASVATPGKLILDAGNRAGARALVLARGGAENIAINLNGVTLTGGSLDIFGELTEE